MISNGSYDHVAVAVSSGLVCAHTENRYCKNWDLTDCMTPDKAKLCSWGLMAT